MTNQALDTIEKFIKEKGVVILDGGLSNQLATYDFDFERSELWTFKVLLEKPNLIKKVHFDYLKAGSDIITSCTYQATFQKLRKFGFNDERIKELFELSCKLADQAIDEFMIYYEKEFDKPRSQKLRPLLAISIGSYGAYLCDGSKYANLRVLKKTILL